MSEATASTFEDLIPLAAEVLSALKTRKLMLATAESCTGGLIAGALTEVAGSSAVVDRGFVTYSNDAKTRMLGVPVAVIAAVGAVSQDVAIAMAEGALKNSDADIAISVTGIAGPGGGSPEKPVGTVHMAIAQTNKPTWHRKCVFSGRQRDQVRLETVRTAFNSIINAIA